MQFPVVPSLPQHPDPSPARTLLFVFNVPVGLNNVNVAIEVGWIECTWDTGPWSPPALSAACPHSTVMLICPILTGTRPLGKSRLLRLTMWLCPQGCDPLAFFFSDWWQVLALLLPELSHCLSEIILGCLGTQAPVLGTLPLNVCKNSSIQNCFQPSW